MEALLPPLIVKVPFRGRLENIMRLLLVAVVVAPPYQIGKGPLEGMRRLETDLREGLLFEEKVARHRSVGESRNQVFPIQVIHLRDPLLENMCGVKVLRHCRVDLLRLKILDDRLIPDADHLKTWAASLRAQ